MVPCNACLVLKRGAFGTQYWAQTHVERLDLKTTIEPCPERIMSCYVAWFCLRHQLPPAWSFCLDDTCGGVAYATSLRHLTRVEALLTRKSI